MSRREISTSDNLSRFLTGIASIAAVLLLILMLFNRIAALTGMMPDLIGIFQFVELVASVAIVIAVAIQACIKQGFIAFLVVGVIGAAVVIMSFFPGVTDRFFGDTAALLSNLI